jgi:hypothetical protein
MQLNLPTGQFFHHHDQLKQFSECNPTFDSINQKLMENQNLQHCAAPTNAALKCGTIE